MSYLPYKLDLSSNLKNKVQSAIEHKKTLSLRLRKTNLAGEKTLLLTRWQVSIIEREKTMNRGVSIKLSKRQLKANIEYKGGFLSMLASLAAQALPAVLGVATGLISGGIEIAISDSELFLHKGGHCYQIRKTDGDGLFLSPHQRLRHIPGDSLFLQHGNNVYDGKWLLLGPNSPFKNIPLLNLLL